MVFYGKVVGGHFMNATISPNRKGELALHLGFKRTPNLTADAITAWEEIISETRGGAAGAVSKVGSGTLWRGRRATSQFDRRRQADRSRARRGGAERNAESVPGAAAPHAHQAHPHHRSRSWPQGLKAVPFPPDEALRSTLIA